MTYERHFASRQRLEEDGLFLEEPQHWEMWESKIYIYDRSNYYYTTKSGKKRKYRSTQNIGMMRIPLDIIKHLGLKNRDAVILAIRKSKERRVSDSPSPEEVQQK